MPRQRRQQTPCVRRVWHSVALLVQQLLRGADHLGVHGALEGHNGVNDASVQRRPAPLAELGVAVLRAQVHLAAVGLAGEAKEKPALRLAYVFAAPPLALGAPRRQQLRRELVAQPPRRLVPIAAA